MNNTDLVKVDDISSDEAVTTARIKLPPSVEFGRQLSSLRDSGAHDLLDEFGKEGEHSWLERPVRLGEPPFLLRLTEGGSTEAATTVILRLQADDTTDSPPTEAEVQA